MKIKLIESKITKELRERTLDFSKEYLVDETLSDNSLTIKIYDSAGIARRYLLEKGEYVVVDNKMPRIYVAHPYGGKEENKVSVEKIIQELVVDNPDRLYISPIHALGFLYNTVSYDKGMEYCIELLKSCDMLILCEGWQESTGCHLEYMVARACNIYIVYYLDGEYIRDEVKKGVV